MKLHKDEEKYTQYVIFCGKGKRKYPASTSKYITVFIYLITIMETKLT